MSDNSINVHNAAVNASFAKLPSFGGSRGYSVAPRNRPCQCGCNGLTARTFTVGHDAKRDARIRAINRGFITLDWLAANAIPGDPEQSMNIAIATARWMGVVYPAAEVKPVKKARKR